MSATPGRAIVPAAGHPLRARGLCFTDAARGLCFTDAARGLCFTDAARGLCELMPPE
ncbi:hypothetical protein AB0B89_21925 [Sphaerisporangium sp. NPDC049002]|uniref:hypothetical protein n=1 Tax=Sphaerisporangium sp. NPDC049002 TaxID=3155392 RepID=UPI0033D2A548